MIFTILLIVFLAFISYAILTQYRNTDPTKPMPARLLASLVAAAATAGAAMVQLLHGWTAPS